MKKNRKILLSVFLIFVVVILTFGFIKFTKPQKKEAYKEGKIEGNHYESTWLGIQFDAPEGFYMYPREELEERAEDARETDDISGKYDMSIDMCAVSDQIGSVTVTVEKREKPDETPDEYADAVRQSQLKNNGPNMQFENEGEISEEMFAGEKYTCLKLQYTLEELRLCSERYIRMKQDCVIVIEFQYDPGDTAGRDVMYQAVREL